MPKVLYKPTEQTISTPVDVQFVRLSQNYGAKLELDVVAALASVPCEECGKTTRDILKEIGVNISNNDSEVDVLEIIAKLSIDETRSTLDPSYVFVITEASIIEDLRNTNKMDDIQLNSRLAKALDEYVKNVLVDHALCNGCCFTSGYINSRLDG